MIQGTMLLGATPPFRLDYTVWTLRRRGRNIVDRWDGSRYSRIVVLNDKPVQLTIRQAGQSQAPKLSLTLQSKEPVSTAERQEVKRLAQKALGLSTDLHTFYALARHNEVLKPLAAQFAGVKPPRFPSVFEALLNAIACQQVTLDLGILLLNRLAEKFGRVFADAGTTCYAFPRPADLADVPEEEIKELGFSRQKARTIKELAVRTTNHENGLSSLEKMTNQEALDALLEIRGIGRWSAEYVLLRGLGRLDVFPGDDVGAQNNLQRLLQLDAKPNYEAIQKLTAPWKPFQGLVYFHLLLARLRLKGVV